MKKSEIVELIIEDLKNNIYHSHDFIFALVKESLKNRTKKELIKILMGQ